jgi:ubiquinone biosynthesis protein UbiJ
MATQSPLSFLADFFQKIPTPTPPAWVVEETQRRVVLLLNHVLMQEPQAMERLVRQSGRVILAQWRSFTFGLRVTPAGLLDLSELNATPDLTLVLSEDSPFALAQTLMQGTKPPVRIEGDVQLAAEVNWLADNLRWDIEEDLSRIMGDAPSHMLMEGVRKLGSGLREFVSRKGANTADTSTGNSA